MATSTQRILVIGAIALALGAAADAQAPPAAGDRSRAADAIPAFVANGANQWLRAADENFASIAQGGSVTFESQNTGEPHDVDFISAPVACSVGGGPPATRVPHEPATTWFAS